MNRLADQLDVKLMEVTAEEVSLDGCGVNDSSRGEKDAFQEVVKEEARKVAAFIDWKEYKRTETKLEDEYLRHEETLMETASWIDNQRQLWIERYEAADEGDKIILAHGLEDWKPRIAALQSRQERRKFVVNKSVGEIMADDLVW